LGWGRPYTVYTSCNARVAATKHMFPVLFIRSHFFPLIGHFLKFSKIGVPPNH
jgi:hypothetical protein